MGRALFDQQLIQGHLVRHLYKHILGWPITFEDLENQDNEYYQSLKTFTTMEDISDMCLDFTITEETLGVRTDIELIPGGKDMEVTKENLSQYLEAILKYRMLDRTKAQINELLLGFFDVIPEPALTVLDPSELELILCGLPTINMDDWECNTKYTGDLKEDDQVVKWFWEVVRDDFDQEMKARLLQFVTGTSGVPSRGFSVLQGNDGNIKKFAIHGVDRNLYSYPRSQYVRSWIGVLDVCSFQFSFLTWFDFSLPLSLSFFRITRLPLSFSNAALVSIALICQTLKPRKSSMKS